MDKIKKVRISFIATPAEREALRQLATFKYQSQAEVLRTLLRRVAREHGLWPPKQHDSGRIHDND